MSQTSAGSLRGRVLTVAGVVLFAFCLRSAVASLSPLLEHIARDFPLPSVVIGLIGAAPAVSYAVFGLVTTPIAQRVGLVRTSVLALALIAAGLTLRGLAPDAIVLLVGTVIAFAGVGMGNVLMPALVKRYFPDRIALMTTVYTTSLSLSTVAGPLFAVPVADATNWRVSLGMWAVFAFAALVPWVVMLVRERAAAASVAGSDTATLPAGPGPIFARMWRIPQAWAIAGTLAMSSIIAYSLFMWLPVIFVDVAGVTALEAGGLLTVFAATGLVGAMVMPTLIVKYHATRAVYFTLSAMIVVGALGMILAPNAALLLWTLLLGGSGFAFPLGLVLIGIRVRDHHTAVALSSFAQSLAYAVTAVFPLLTGVLHDLTGGWTVPLLVLAGVIVVLLPAGWIAGSRHTIEEAWERRHGTW